MNTTQQSLTTLNVRLFFNGERVGMGRVVDYELGASSGSVTLRCTLEEFERMLALCDKDGTPPSYAVSVGEGCTITRHGKVELRAPPIQCCDECRCVGVWDEEEALDRVWTLLQASGRWRCADCARALRAAAAAPGRESDEGFVDPLPPTSRGALPRATAGTIAPTSVQP